MHEGQMSETYAGPKIAFDETSFEPMKVMPVAHQLMGHPLLKLDKLAALGRRLAAKNSVRAHNDEARPDTSFHYAPDTHKAQWSPEMTLERIAEAKAWMSLLNIQQDPEYRTLVDEILEDVRPRVTKKDPGMSYRAGWIFITSPGAVTPFHCDHEHNFILQVAGKKTLRVWEPLDRDVISDEGLELFNAAHSRDLVKWRPELDARAHLFELKPGMGGYMPTNAAHYVKNGDEVSITVSATYYTDLTRRRKLIYCANHAMRKTGISPSPLGAGADAAKLAGYRAARAVSHAVSKLRGRETADLHVRYAPA
jgi:oxalate decarboxylase/phosphoglucose isomerase-like protein (cupin superfamily)